MNQTTFLKQACAWAVLVTGSLACGLGCGDGEPVPAVDGASIMTAAELTWTWVDVEGMRCANGEATGIGINRSSASPNVVIYLEGGGACWNHETCYDLELASFISESFTKETFQNIQEDIQEFEVFNRDDTRNPMRDWTQIYVPYCTGDLHAGSSVNDYNGQPTLHVGRDNIARLLETLSPVLPNVERALLTGASAGGYGATLAYAQVAEHWQNTRVDMLNDGGPPLPAPPVDAAKMRQWTGAWNTTPPPGCGDCDSNLASTLEHNIAAHPNARFGVLSFTVDPVLMDYYAIDAPTFTEALEVLQADSIANTPNARVFYVEGEGHTMIGDQDNANVDGQDAWSWTIQMLQDDPDWDNVAP